MLAGFLYEAGDRRQRTSSLRGIKHAAFGVYIIPLGLDAQEIAYSHLAGHYRPRHSIASLKFSNKVSATPPPDDVAGDKHIDDIDAFIHASRVARSSVIASGRRSPRNI